MASRVRTRDFNGDTSKMTAIDLRAVPGIGAEIVLSVDGELRRTRLFSRA